MIVGDLGVLYGGLQAYVVYHRGRFAGRHDAIGVITTVLFLPPTKAPPTGEALGWGRPPSAT